MQHSRRTFLHRLVAGIGAVGLAACRPADLEGQGSGLHPEWMAFLVDKDEPGERMIVTGRVFGPEGRTVREGILVHVYHTDAEGHYSKGGVDENQHRIQGTMRTNEAGRYEYHTIRPASYPNTTVIPHVHYTLTGPSMGRQQETLRLKTAAKIPVGIDSFDPEQILVKDDQGIWRCTFDLKLKR